MLVDGGIELLTEEEARVLLAGGEVGRIGISIGALPGDPGQLPARGRRHRVPHGTGFEAVRRRLESSGSRSKSTTTACWTSSVSILAVGRAEVIDVPISSPP